MNHVLAGLQIIAKYDANFETSILHDFLIVGVVSNIDAYDNNRYKNLLEIEMSKEDVDALIELKWIWDQVFKSWKVCV